MRLLATAACTGCSTVKAFETVCEELGHLTAYDVLDEEDDDDNGSSNTGLWVAHKRPLSTCRVRTCPNDHLIKRHVTVKDGWRCACCKFSFPMHQVGV